ncbi:ankyrin repeat-containing domain protein [Geranomyces variabilis]|nr:ankyrin repeat-containing domain protein [Geranomyces variabilis]
MQPITYANESDCAQLILDVGSRMTRVQQSIQEAAFKGDHNLVASLTTANPDAVRVKDEDGRTALHWAASGKHLEITRALLAAGADATTTDEGGMTPLHIAASTGSLEIAQLLLEAAPAVIDNKTESGQTALHYAASKNHVEAPTLRRVTGMAKHPCTAPRRADGCASLAG